MLNAERHALGRQRPFQGACGGNASTGKSASATIGPAPQPLELALQLAIGATLFGGVTKLAEFFFQVHALATAIRKEGNTQCNQDPVGIVAGFVPKHQVSATDASTTTLLKTAVLDSPCRG